MNCEEKHRFTTRKRALCAAASRGKKVGIKLYAYKCPDCGFWHITKSEPSGSPTASFRRARAAKLEEHDEAQ